MKGDAWLRSINGDSPGGKRPRRSTPGIIETRSRRISTLTPLSTASHSLNPNFEHPCQSL
jgi:hypothetical protein